MTSSQWNRLKDLFQLALELRPEDRAEWLARHAGDDPELAAHAQALLDASDTPGGFLDAPLEVGLDDVTAMLATAAIQPGDRVGQYEILRELGRGGMGVVYLARDTDLGGREVALKALPAEVSADPVRRERLRREAIAAAKIVHAGIAAVYALKEIDGNLFIDSEFVEGRSLRQELAGAALPAGRAIGLTLEIVNALGAVHAAGVVHRDLKPENVLLTLQGRVKLVDFGIAHVEAADGLTVPGVLLGTPAYMAPEQLVGGAVDARTDIYAVGVLLGEMLAGMHPRRRSEWPAFPRPLGAIVSRCLQADPAARFQSTTELQAALEAAAAGRHTPAQEARWWWRFHQGAVGLAYAGLLVPAWMARAFMGGRIGLLVFLLLMTGGIVAITLRLHLWFVSLKSDEDLPVLRTQTRPWLRLADVVFAAGMLGSGLFVGAAEPVLAIVLSGAAVIATVAFLVIEPSTARAAFRDGRA